MAVNDWNTPMADTSGIQEVANDLGNMGFDVHTVNIVLDNGAWTVAFLSTDEDMNDHAHYFILDRSGHLEREDNAA